MFSNFCVGSFLVRLVQFKMTAAPVLFFLVLVIANGIPFSNCQDDAIWKDSIASLHNRYKRLEKIFDKFIMDWREYYDRMEARMKDVEEKIEPLIASVDPEKSYIINLYGNKTVLVTNDEWIRNTVWLILETMRNGFPPKQTETVR